jgi:hypothetical protein
MHAAIAAGRAARSMRHRLCRALAVVLAVPALAAAAPPVELYAARVPVTAVDGAGLDAAFARALAEVFVKVSGDRRAAGAAGRDAATLVSQYQPQADGQVRVQFDPVAVRARLDAAGLPVWVAPRPVTLVAVPAPAPVVGAVATGAPAPPVPAVAGGAAPADPVAATAEGRGLPIVRAPDGTRIDAAGDDDGLLARARAAGAAALLVATPEPTLGPAAWRWTLVGPGPGERSSWTGDPAEGIHGLADRLAGRYASPPGSLADVEIRVSGITDFPGYRRFGDWLEATGIVEEWAVAGLSSEAVRYRLRVRGGPGQLQAALASGGVLEPVDEAGSVPLYRLARLP